MSVAQEERIQRLERTVQKLWEKIEALQYDRECEVVSTITEMADKVLRTKLD